MLRKLLIAVCCLHCYGIAFSQLCTGSLGDPLVNITFGHGANPGAPLAAAATGYSFVSGDCPNDGFYTVRTNTSGCFGDSWHNLTTDHTGDGSGYFMLVNASYDPGTFYVDTVKGLCGGSTYEFAAWIINVISSSACGNNSTQPDLTFTIESTAGTVLQTYNTGSIPPTGSPQWKQYGFFFATPAGAGNVVLRIVNNAPGGCGNDLALDDITFRPCGPQLTPSVTGQTTTTLNLCEGIPNNYTLNCAVSAGFTNPVYQWQAKTNGAAWADIPGANTLSYNYNIPPGMAAGTYEFRLSVAEAGSIGSPQCRINSEPLQFIIHPNPMVTVSNNGPVCEGKPIELTATGGTQYSWSGPGGYTASGATVTISGSSISQAGLYNVTVTSDAGCTATGSTTVSVLPAPDALVPFSDTAICINDSIALFASGGTGYEWSPSAGLSSPVISNPKASPASETAYKVMVTNTDGCTDTASVHINVYEKAIANAGPDKILIAGNSVALDAAITNTYQNFYWDPAPGLTDPLVLQPIVAPAEDITYRLNVVSPKGCGTSSDEVNVKVYKGIFIPNAFTPNDDGLNDTWSVPMLDAYPKFELNVFSRYGQIVFANKAVNMPWDGRFKGEELPAGAYPYVIRLNDDKKTVLKGMVIIIR